MDMTLHVQCISSNAANGMQGPDDDIDDDNGDDDDDGDVNDDVCFF